MKAYKRSVQRRYYERHREAYVAKTGQQQKAHRHLLQARVNAIKIGAGCLDCGYCEHPRALDFDHVTGGKIASIAQMVHRRRPWRMIETEILKCVVRCANCHRIKTWEGHQP